MLLAIFASLGVGIFSRRLGRHGTILVVMIASTLTALYFLRPQYMT
jgi:hypothetical protein